jgi:hypothetical protein
MDGGRDSFEAYGENEEIIEYPIMLELANALLNLSYAQLGLKQWRTSFYYFIEAMDIFVSELPEGETPMSQGGAKKGDQSSWGERLTSFFFKKDAGVNEDGGEEDRSTEKADTSSQQINVTNYQMMDNFTIEE